MTLGQRLRTTTALHAVAAVALIAAPLPAAAQLAPDAHPTGGQVVAGQASIGRSPTTTTISQSSQRAAVNWQSFDVGSQQTVQFNQPSSSAVTLNRVVGPNPSEIAGRIQANGQLVVVNQAGVVFSRGSQVNAAGLVVSAAGISDGNFMAGKMVFDQAANPNARIENRGTITVKDHGLAALVAPQVRNSGTIQAKLGTVILAGAEAETLDLYGDGLVTINVTKQVRSAPDGTKALVTNTGTIAAKGGSVVLTADAVDGVVQTLVDAGGRISADSTAARTGRVLISGSGGDVRVEGVVTAQGNAPGLAGGTVQVSGSNATIVGAHARISASGHAGGGTIALGTTLARAQGNATGIAAATTKTLVVRKGATISADATAKGGGGRVVLLSSHSTSMAGTITARGGTQGGDGGFVEVSGGLLTLTGHVDASATVGTTGTLLLDPSNLWVSDTKPAVATSWVSPALLESENANISLAATDNLNVASTYMGGNTLNLGSHTLSLTGGTGLTIDRGFTIDASRISLTTLAGTIALDGASGVAGGLITAPQLAMLSDTGLAAPVMVMAGAGGIALGGAMLGSAGTPLGILDLSSSGGGVTQDAGGSVFAGTLQSTGGVAHGVDLAGTANAIGKLGTFTAGTGFTLNDDTARLTVVGAVKGGSSVSLTNTGSLVIGAAVTATGTVGLYGDGITQTSAGVITAGTLTGDAGGGAAHIGITTNDVADLGTFSAGQGFGLRDDVARLKVTGAVDGGIAVYIVNTGSVLIGAPLTASGIVDLHGNGITQTSAGVVTAGTLTGDSGSAPANIGITTNNVATLGVFHAGDGFGLRDDTPTLRVAGAVDGGIAVYIVNSGSVVIGAPITATGIVDLNGNGIAQTGAGIVTAGTLIGDAGAGAAAFTTAKNVVSGLGRFAATTGFGLKDAVGTLTVTDAVNGGTGVALANTGSLAIDAALTATGTVALTGVGITQNVSGIITAGTLTGNAGSGFAKLDVADNKVAALGPFTAGAGFGLNDDKAALTVVGPVAGGNSLAIVNTGSLAIDAAIGASGTVRLAANGITQSSAGRITAGSLNGSAGSGGAALGAATNRVTELDRFTATSGFTLNDGVVKLTVADAVDGGTGVALTNTGSLAIDAAISGTGTVALIAAGIGQDINGIITAGTLTGSAGADAAQFDGAANKVSNLGPFTAGTGFALNDRAAGLTVVGSIHGGPSVSLANTGSLAIDAPIGAGGTVTLNANGIAQTGAGIITASKLTGSAGSGAAELGVATNMVGTLGPFSAATGFDLNDGVAGLTVTGAVDGGSSARLANTGSLVLHAPVSATGLVTLDGNGIVQNAAGVITAARLAGNAGAGGAQLGQAVNAVTDLGGFSATDGFTLNDSVRVLTVADTVNGGSQVQLTNTGALVIGAAVDATGEVKLDADGISQTAAGIITAGTLAGDAGGGVFYLGPASNLVTWLGPVTAGTGFTLTDATPQLTVAGAVDGGTFVTLTNSGSLAIQAAIDASNTVTLDANGITQTASGVITASTLTGNAGTGAADLGTAANLVTNLGAFTAATGFTLKDAVGTLKVAGAVDGGTGVSLTNTGSLVINAGVSGTGTVALTAVGISQDASGVITAGTLTGTAGSGAAQLGGATNAVSNVGPFAARAGIALNNDTPALTVVGAVDGGPSVTLTNTGNLALDAAVGGTNSVALNANGITQTAAGIITTDSLSGTAGSGSAALGTATNLVTNLGPFTAATGFTLHDNIGTLTVAGAVNGGTDVSLTNTGRIALDAAIGGTSTVALNAKGITQTAAGIITTGTLSGSAGSGSAALGTATNLVTNLGPFTATTGFTLKDAVGTLTVAGAVDGGTGVSLTNTGSLAIDAGLSATGTVALTAVGISQDASGVITAGTLTGTAGSGAAQLDGATNAVSNLGPFTAGAGFALNNDTPALTVVGAVDGGPTISLKNSGSLAIAAALGGTSSVALNANGITQTASGVITAGTLVGSAGTGGAALGTATNLVTNLGPFTATTGFMLNDNASTLTVAGAVDGGTGVSLTNTGSLAIDAGVSATGTVALTAVGISQDASGVITAGTLSGTAGGGSAQLDAASNAVSNLGPFTAGAGIALNNDTPALTVVGAIDGGPSVTLTNTGSLALDAAIDPTNTVTLNANGITQTAAGVITAGTLTGSAGTGSADLGTATNLVTYLGPFTATTGFTLNDAVGTLTVAGAVDGGTGVALTNTGSLVINAGLSGTDTVALNAVGISQDASGVITAGTLTGTAGSGAAQLDGATNAVSNLGPFTADAGFALNNDTPALSVVGAIDGGPSVTLTNTGSLALDAATGGTSTVALNANGITQTAGGIITTDSLIGSAGGGSADLGTATNVVGNLGPFSAATGFTLNDNVGTVTVAGEVNGGTGVSLTNTGSLVINAAVSGTNTVALTAVGISQDAAGVITAGTLTGTSGSGAAAFGTARNVVTNLGPFTAGAGLTLNNDTPALTVIGAVDGGPTLSLTNTGGLAIDAAVSATGTVSLTANGIAQTVDGVITAGTLIGNAGTGDADLAAATNMIANLGPFTAAGTFQLLDGTGLAVIGNVAAGADATIGVTGDGNGLVVNPGVIVQAESGTAALTASGGDIINNGSVVGAVLAALTASHDIDQNSTIIADVITETAGHDINHTGYTDATTGTDTLIAGNDIVQTGAVLASSGSSVLTAGHDLTQSGVVNGNIDSTLTATTGTLTQSGTVGAGINTTLVAGTDLFQSGIDVAIQGAASLTAGGSLTQSGIVKAGDDATLKATSGALTQSGTITAGDSATLTAGTNLIQTGTVDATGGSVSLTAVDNLTQSKIVKAGANATLTAVYGTLAQNGTVAAGGNATLTATSGSLNQAGTVAAGNDATLTAGTNLIQTGTVDAIGGSANLMAIDNLTQSKIVTAGSNAALTAIYGTLAQNGTVTAGGDATLTATTGPLDQAGIVTAGNAATLTAGTNLLQTGTVTAAGGSASLTAVDNLTQSKIVKAGTDVTLTVLYGTLAQNGTVAAGGNATLTAVYGPLDQTGTVTAGNDATLTAGTNLSQTGTVDATGGSASLMAVDNLTQSMIVTAGTNVALTATNGTLAQNGTITAGGDASLTAINGPLVQAGTVTAGGDATLAATNGPLDQFGIVTAGNSATLTAGTDLLQAGTVAATGGDATLAATGALTQSNLVTAGGNATLTATNGTLTQSGVVSAGSDASLGAINGTLDQFGTVTAGQSAALTAGADLLQTGTVNAANGNATLTATGNLTQAYIVSAGGDATLAATNGTLDQSGTVTAGGNAALAATNGTLDQSGLVVAGGSANLTAGLDLAQTGTVHADGGDATLTAARNLTQSDTVTASNDATLTAGTGDLTQTGNISAGTSAILQATSANLSDGGTITAPNIQLAARSGAVSFYGSFAGVQPDPTLNPQNKLKQGSFPTNLSIGAWISGSTITVAPTALVTGAGGGVSQLAIALTSPTGTVTFGNFNNTKTQLYLGLGTGFAAGQIEVDTLQVEYTPPGTLQTINLTGTVNGQGGSTAASASFIQPLTKENYQVNGCPIESTSCIHITTLSLPTINPLKDLEVSTPEQADDILIILPDVGDRDY